MALNPFPKNTPANRIFSSLTRRVPRLKREPADLDEDTLQMMELAAERQEITIEAVETSWLKEKAAEYHLLLEVEEKWEQLTEAQQHVIARYCLDYRDEEIAQLLNTTASTVRKHISNAMEKFNVRKREHLKHLLHKWDFSAYDT